VTRQPVKYHKFTIGNRNISNKIRFINFIE
jgi:hypothetical protein